MSTRFTYIDSASQLEQLVQRLSVADRVALDTEANSLHNYHERVCLIQLSAGDEHCIVDPLADMDMTPLLRALATKELVLHGADYDLRIMRSTFGFEPGQPVIDTMLAAQLLGIDRIGYAALVEQYFDVKLPKAGQKSNWGRRPLTDAQLDYASDDTRYLGDLAGLLTEQLDSLGRITWHQEWCRRIVGATAEPSGRVRNDAWRLRGTGTLSRKQLCYVHEIWKWRDKQAERADVPPFKILGNQPLLDLAVWGTGHPGVEVESKGPRLPRHCEGRRLQALKIALRRADNTPRDKWPERQKKREHRPAGPECKPQIEALRNACADIAADLGIAASVLAPKAMMVAIARNDARTQEPMQACSGMMNWQAELLEVPIAQVLETFDGEN